MPQPPAYSRTKDFTEDFGSETDHSALNAELDNASNSINDVRANLAVLQADDGKLRPAVVTTDSLSPALYTELIDTAASGAATAAATATTKADEAAASATAAAVSAAAAGTSAANADADAIAAAASASAAATSATNADASKTAAAASETAAASSASSASTSASTATTKASEAATSATNAAASATAAATSETDAAASEANAATSASDAIAAKIAAEAAQAAAEDTAATINDANLVHMTGDETIEGVKTFSSNPAFRAYRSGTNQSISSGTETVLQLQSESFDTNSAYDITTYRFTPLVPGYYQFSGRVFLGDSTGVTRSLLSIYKNNVVEIVGNDIGDASGYGLTVSGLVYLNGTTDYVDMRTTIVATTSIVRSGESITYFSGHLARAA